MRFFIVLLVLFSSSSFAYDLKASVVRVVDGDTIIVNIHEWPKEIGEDMRVRLANIDAPEMKGECIDKASESKRFLGFIQGKEVMLKNVNKGKYFRLVAEVWYGGVDMGELMVDMGYVVRYGEGSCKDE